MFGLWPWQPHGEEAGSPGAALRTRSLPYSDDLDDEPQSGARAGCGSGHTDSPILPVLPDVVHALLASSMQGRAASFIRPVVQSAMHPASWSGMYIGDGHGPRCRHFCSNQTARPPRTGQSNVKYENLGPAAGPSAAAGSRMRRETHSGGGPPVANPSKAHRERARRERLNDGCGHTTAHTCQFCNTCVVAIFEMMQVSM